MGDFARKSTEDNADDRPGPHDDESAARSERRAYARYLMITTMRTLCENKANCVATCGKRRIAASSNACSRMALKRQRAEEVVSGESCRGMGWLYASPLPSDADSSFRAPGFSGGPAFRSESGTSYRDLSSTAVGHIQRNAKISSGRSSESGDIHSAARNPNWPQNCISQIGILIAPVCRDRRWNRLG